MAHTVTLVPGDHPQLVPHLQRLVQALGVDLHWETLEEPFSADAAAESIRRNGVALVGFQRGRREERLLPPAVALRRALGTFAQLRPLRTLPGLSSRFEGVDLLVVRETTEDVYAHLEHETIPGVFESLKVTTRGATQRIARYAFELARLQGRRRVTIVHKANIMKASDGLFLHTAREIGREFPEIEVEDAIVDALCMKLVLDPSRFDVLLCGNLFGDIVADLACGLVGGASNAPSINVAPGGAAVFTVGQGCTASEPDLINPLTMVLPLEHLLRHLDEGAAADHLHQQLIAALASHRPRALGGTHGLADFFGALS